MKYQIGSIVKYRTYQGITRTVRITHKCLQVLPQTRSFIGTLLATDHRGDVGTDSPVMGYEEQIVAVLDEGDGIIYDRKQ